MIFLESVPGVWLGGLSPGSRPVEAQSSLLSRMTTDVITSPGIAGWVSTVSDAPVAL